ncbi:hypothetical protein Drose_14540 [Dactylosporangium roseum]|uniref:Carbohydrate ABC transporter permease n=1 Tax=Dactylosporangium roseum TaxID=47989 RepID=A0ABY5ZEG5_9ACTN|nr:hypothetical protein [Dactylosporangium roseum]UWZ39343.1 hypothetical protein Drose_14540 [Dactylosporangium roseum]
MTTPALARPLRRIRPGRVLLHGALVLGGLTMLFPFVWMLLTSFKSDQQMLNNHST